MKITLTDSYLNKPILEKTISFTKNEINDVTDTTIEANYKSLQGKLEMHHFDDVLISKGTYRSKEAFSIHGSNDLYSSGVEMHFNLKGISSGKVKGEKDYLTINQNEHNIGFFPKSEGEFHFPKNADIEMIEVTFSKNYFKRFANYNHPVIESILNAIEKNIPFRLKQNGKMNPQIHQCIRDINQTNPYCNLRQLFLESKILELLNYQLHTFYSVEQKEYLDINQLEYAGEYLKSHMQNPPTTAELARILNTNEFKLKKHFKHYYGNSIYSYVIEQRMNFARQLLLDTRLPVGDIAIKIGYSTQQHFSTAFKKFYAVSPRQLRKI